MKGWVEKGEIRKDPKYRCFIFQQKFCCIDKSQQKLKEVQLNVIWAGSRVLLKGLSLCHVEEHALWYPTPLNAILALTALTAYPFETQILHLHNGSNLTISTYKMCGFKNDEVVRPKLYMEDANNKY